MLKIAIKVAGSIAKASKTKTAPDIINAGTKTVGLVNKMAKKKKKDEERKQLARR